MTLSDLAQRLYDALPEDGGKVGGITLQRDLKITKTEYGTARDELKQEGLCVSGKGRGGSLARIEGKAPEEKKTNVESLEIAREEKKARSREQKYHDEIREIAARWCREKLDYEIRQPNEVHLSYGKILVAVWRDDGSRKADMYQIPQLEVDQIRAEIKFEERNKNG